MTTIEPPKETLQKHLDRQGRLSQWISLEAFNWLADSQARQAANEEAENRWWRKKWSGDEMPVGESDEMRQTILGDVTHPAPIIMQPQQSSTLQNTLAAAAIAASAGMGGYLYATKDDVAEPTQPAPSVQYEDESVTIGLGKIEDYIKEEN